MANWKRTLKASTVVSLIKAGVTEGGAWHGTTSDPHPPIGNELGTTRIGRMEAYFGEPTWPSSGHLVDAHLTIHRSPTSEHSGYRGSSPRASVERINDAHPDREHPSSTGGSAKTFAVDNASETHQVWDLVEETLPSRIKRRSKPDVGCGNRPFGKFQVRSTDEGDDHKSFIATDDVYLTVEIKTAVNPDPPLIVSITGAQLDDLGAPITSPTMVATTGGDTLEVVFAFRGAPGDYPAKARIDLYGVGATDAAVTPFIKGTGWVKPTPAGGAGQYRIKLTGITKGTIGRFRVNTLSQKNQEGDPTSLDGDEAWVKMVVLPGPPLDIVFQPFAGSPTIGFTLNSPDPTDYVTGGRAVVTFLPDGAPQWDSTMVGVGDGSSRRVVLPYQGPDLAPGQSISFFVETRNRDQVTSRPSAPRTQTVQQTQAVTFSPAPGRLTSRTPTITLTFPTADGARLRLLDPADDTKVVYDSGPVALVNQTSHAFAIPAGTLAWGQDVNAVGSYLPDGVVSPYTDESAPIGYHVPGLPTTALSVPDSFAGRVDTTDPYWLRTVTDPDGAPIAALEQEVRVAATPQGSGALVTDFYRHSFAPLSPVQYGTIPYETAVDSRARARNDIAVLASTTLSAPAAVGATSVTVASTTGFVVGGDFVIVLSGFNEARVVATLPGAGVVTFAEPLDWAHAAGEPVQPTVLGPWSPWVRITALQPPAVDLITPINGATINDPTDTLVASFTGYGSPVRTLANATFGIYDVDGAVVATIDNGTDPSLAIPAYLLDHETVYRWDVTMTDSMGMTTTSVQRYLFTSFAEPLGVDVVTAVSVDGGMAVTWPDSPEPYLDHYEVVWINDAGEPVRIDGGPETQQDGNPAFTGTSLTHIGARLGANVYYVAVSNGWHASDPVSTSADLVRSDHRTWEAVDETGAARGLIVTQASMPHAGTIERFQPPGGQPVQVTHGSEARSFPMTIFALQSEDGEIVSALREWMATGAPQWVKGPAPYLLDPLWATLQSFTPSLEPSGSLSIDCSWLELGDPVHAILPAAVIADAGEGNIYATTDVLDFGTLPEV